MQKMKLNHQLTPYTKINSRQIRLNSQDIPHTNIFTDMSPIARDIKERINKWDLIKIENFAWLKKTVLK